MSQIYLFEIMFKMIFNSVNTVNFFKIDSASIYAVFICLKRL